MAQKQQIVLITGGNTGLGFEIAKALYASKRSYHILLGGRNFEKARTATKEIGEQVSESTSSIEAVQIDIEDDESIEHLAASIQSRHGRLDVLINNAGASFDRFIKSSTLTSRQAWAKSWDVNVVGAQLLTEILAPLLIKGTDPRLVFITSGTSNLTDHGTVPKLDTVPAAGWPKGDDFIDARTYRCAKTGLNMLMREWSRILKNDGVKVFGVSPGVLATGLAGIGRENMRRTGALDASLGGELVRDVVQGVRDGNVGLVVRPVGVQPW